MKVDRSIESTLHRVDPPTSRPLHQVERVNDHREREMKKETVVNRLLFRRYGLLD